MSITLSGAASGIDTSALITATVDAASGPKRQLEARQEDYSGRVSKITELISLMDTMEDSLEAIEEIGDFRSFSATYDEDDADFEVAVDGDAVAGTYDVTVNTLARAQMDVSASTFASRTASLDFNSGDTLDLTYDGTTTSIDLHDGTDGLTLVELSNAIDDIDGLTSYTVYTGSVYQLVIQGDDEGEAITVVETATGTDSLNMATSIAATDAEIEINGITITDDTNIITDAIPGMTLTLTDATATSFSVVVAEDPDAIEEQVQTFVDAYNAVVSFINVNSVFDADTGIRGEFVGEASVKRVLGGLRTEITSEYADLSQGYDALSLVGIELDGDGVLEIDSDVFQEVVVDEPDQVADLFTSADGFVASMLARIDLYTDSIDGSLEVRKDTLEDRISDLEDQIDAQDRRLARLQARLTTQYAGMESMISSLSSSAGFLATLTTA